MFFEKAHNGRNAWYLYLLTLIVVFLSSQVMSLPYAVYVLLQGKIAEASTISDNIGLALVLLGFLGGLVMFWVCIRFIHQKQFTDIVTGRSKFDWGRFKDAALIWAVFMVMQVVYTLLTSKGDMVWQFDVMKFIPLLLIALLLLPFQTSFEELVFRGYLMQGFSLVFRSKWAACILTSLIFGFMHYSNPEVATYGVWVAIPQYVTMGFILGLAVLLDDGLEFALGIHFINNFFGCVVVTTSNSVLSTSALWVIKNPQVSIWDTVVMLVFGIAAILLLNIKYHFLKTNEK